MHPTISYHLTQARIADLRQHARRDTLARAARRRGHAAPMWPTLGPRADWVRVRSSQLAIDHVHP